MASRAERRRQAREAARQEQLQAGEITLSKNEIKRMARQVEEEKKKLSTYTGTRDAEQLRRRSEALDITRKIIEHHGITAKDLEDAREAGRQEGFKQAGLPIIKCCYAGIVLALHDEFGFGENRCYRAIKAVDEKIVWALNHSELCDEVLEKTGLQLDLDEPFERVTKKE